MPVARIVYTLNIQHLKKRRRKNVSPGLCSLLSKYSFNWMRIKNFFVIYLLKRDWNEVYISVCNLLHKNILIWLNCCCKSIYYRYCCFPVALVQVPIDCLCPIKSCPVSMFATIPRGVKQVCKWLIMQTRGHTRSNQQNNKTVYASNCKELKKN